MKLISQAQLQDEILRFEGRFTAALNCACEPMDASQTPGVSYQALKYRLDYSSSVLAIALGPVPEANLIDMITLVELGRKALEEHWIPELFQAEGRALAATFDRAIAEIWAVAELVLNAQQRKILGAIIREWHLEHREQKQVVSVRMSRLADASGALTQTHKRTEGLLADIKRATFAVDATRLLGERALYGFQRMPFLWRIQARLATREIVHELYEATGLSRLATMLGRPPFDGVILGHREPPRSTTMH